MEQNSQSYNTTVLGRSPFKFLLPQLPQLVLYMALTFLIVLAFNVPAIWNGLTSAGPGWSEITSSNTGGLYKAWHAVSNSNFVAAFFWGALGCAIYLAFWFIRSLITNIRNDLVVASYVHPVTYKEYLFWRSLILRKLFFGLSLLALLVYMYAGTKIFGALAHFSFWRIETGLNLAGYLQLAGVVVAGMLLLHGFTLLLKLTFNFWQFIYRDL
jgi:hypothetical protein